MRTCNRCGGVKEQAKSGRWRCRPCEAAYQRANYAANVERIRERKRADMARRRADPELRERMNASRRTPEQRARDRAHRGILRDERFFAWRARNWSQRHRVPMTAIQLAGLWMRQRGRCALTGERLDRRAVLDHDIPKSRGGSHGVDNLQWVTARANTAKGDMTTAEFVAMCSQVAEWIGRQLLASLEECV